MPGRRLAVAILLSLLPVAVGGRSHSREIAIIVNPSDRMNDISAEDLKAVFLGAKGSLKDAGQVRPVLLKGGPTHEAFLKEYLGKSNFALQTFYRSLVFSGQGAFPKTVNSDAEAIAYVRKTRGVIGYIDPSAITADVKIVRVK